MRFGGIKNASAGHVVVFSNEEPPEGLLHKCVHLLRVPSMDTPAASLRWEFPGQQLDGSNPALAAKQFLEKDRSLALQCARVVLWLRVRR